MIVKKTFLLGIFTNMKETKSLNQNLKCLEKQIYWRHFSNMNNIILLYTTVKETEDKSVQRG